MGRTISTTILAHLAAAGLVGCPGSSVPAPATSSTPATTAAPSNAPSISSSTAASTSGTRGEAEVGETCKVDEDCRADLHCTLGFDGAEFTETGHCTEDVSVYEGRPLVVDGRAQVAPLRDAEAWLEPAAAQAANPAATLDERQRTQWAALLGRAAQDEHASIPSFARALCQLVALGAPSSLVDKTQRAIADEIRHARICISWARRLGETQTDPGPLPAAVAPFDTEEETGAALLEDVFWGGCVGETLAAHRMQARASTAPLPDLGEAMAEIAEDEARHAALAFETVRWLVEDRPSLRERLDDHLAQFARSASPSDRATLAPLLDVLSRASA